MFFFPIQYGSPTYWIRVLACGGGGEEEEEEGVAAGASTPAPTWVWD